MTALLLTIFYLLFSALAWKRLNWAVLLIVAALPSYLTRFHLGPIPTTLLEGMVLITTLVWMVRKLQNVTGSYKTLQEVTKHLVTSCNLKKPLVTSVLLFLLASTISMFLAPDLRAAAGIWKAYFVEPILFFVVLLDLLKQPQYNEEVTRCYKKLQDVTKSYRTSCNLVKPLVTSRNIITALSITALALSIYAIYQRFTGFGIPPPWNAELRVTSIFPYPNALGLFLGPLVPLFIARLLKVTGSYRKLQEVTRLEIGYWILVIATTLTAIVFAKSTGAIIGITAGLIFMGIFVLRVKTNDRQKSPARKFYILHFTFYILVLIGVVAVLLSVPRIRTELSLKDWSGHVRRTQWSETWEMFKDTSTSRGVGRPILGAGLAGYKEALAPYHKATYLEIFEYPHNIVLNFWSETGLLGTLSFIWLIIVFFRYTFKPLGIGNWELGIPVMASMLVILVHGLVDVPYFKNDLAILFWIVYALGVANYKKSYAISNQTLQTH